MRRPFENRRPLRPRFGSPLLLALLACATPVAAQPSFAPSSLAREIAEVMDAERFDGARWGAVVVDLETGQALFSRDADGSYVPASNCKLFTTAAALDLLGPDYRYETALWAEGPVMGSTLFGNLVVQGAGDPTLGGRWERTDPTRVFQAWADALRARGVTRVVGDVIGDDNLFADEPLGLGWEEEDLLWAYGAESSGLAFHEATVGLRVAGTRPGRPAAVTWEPAATDYVRIRNLSTTVVPGGGIREGYARSAHGNTITVTTEVAADTADEEALAVRNPTEYTLRVLIETFRREGIEIAGRPIDVDDWDRLPDYGRMERLASHRSVALREIVDVTNTDSHNLFAEHLLRTLGALRYDGLGSADPGSVEAGLDALHGFLDAAGIDSYEVGLVDGSGLSPLNRLSPRVLMRLLRYMDAHPDRSVRQAFVGSLAIGGRTGTLERRFRRGLAYDNVRAKTGYINGARSLSGYVTTAGGSRLAFAILCNDYPTSLAAVTAAQDEIVEALAQHRR